LTALTVKEMKQEGKKFIGKDYDLTNEIVNKKLVKDMVTMYR
jgi:hypothetical protein